MAHMSDEEFSELQKFHSMFREKCDEEIQLLEQITRAKLDLQQLKLRLAACGVHDASLIPTNMKCGGHMEDTSVAEIRSFVKWLAESCEFKDPVIFDVGAAVRVGSRDAFLGRMISWPLSEPGGLKLNVPQNLEGEIKGLLERVRRSPLAQKELQHFARTWEMIGAEVAGEGSTRPAIFLIHRETDETVVVAAWPSIQPVVKAVFDPDEYFKCLASKPSDAALPSQDNRSQMEPPNKHESSGLSSSSCDRWPPLMPTSKGDGVELRSDSDGRTLTKSRSAGHLQQ